MSNDDQEAKPEVVEDGLKEMKIKSSASSDDEALDTIRVGTVKDESQTPNGTSLTYEPLPKSASQSPSKLSSNIQLPKMEVSEQEEVVGGDITVIVEPGQAPKLSRTASKKVFTGPATLFNHYADSTSEATSTFELLRDCHYMSKYLGSTEPAMECDCSEEWDAITRVNNACGEDSDCINRATKMECVGDCGCGSDCQNQRFQRRQYATVSVIKTEKKGYGLRADTGLHPGDFIFEYIGEVINEKQFRSRMIQYDTDKIKHFYFMSLSKSEFVDATKKGNLGRFCNHSCNPNCYVDKWVVGDKLRMGIFAERTIHAGEELVFNYNVDRYGADPQPCYCGEPNCTGFLGGKTQSDRSTKLSNATQEALGIEGGDEWETAVAKKIRKKKTGEDDEAYVDSIRPKSLDEDSVTKVMATLNQCKERWIAEKLLSRIQQCEEERVRNRVVKMHGYRILNTALLTWKEDFGVVFQILDVLNKLPRLTRNKISESKIEGTVESFTNCEDSQVQSLATGLLQEWSTLEVAYRIPRKKREPNSTVTDRPDRFERRESAREERKDRSRSRSRSRSIDIPRGPSAPTGPRGNMPQRSASYFSGPRPPIRRFNNPLPSGWFQALAEGGKVYYYSAGGGLQWTRPTMPAVQPPPPPKAVSSDKALQDIIDSCIIKSSTPNKTPASLTPQPDARGSKHSKKEGKEKWRSLSEDKKKKLYENTLFPHIKYVMDKYKSKLPRDDLKRFAKEISKKLVNSDFKNKRVEDPTYISLHQERQVKKYVKDYFDKAVAKKRDHDKKKADRKEKEGAALVGAPLTSEIINKEGPDSGDENVMDVSDDETKVASVPGTPGSGQVNGEGLKRKRDPEDGMDGDEDINGDATNSKRLRSESPPPPPPPPPPAPEMEDGSMIEEAQLGDAEASDNASQLVDMEDMSNSTIVTDTGLPDDAGFHIPPPPPPPGIEELGSTEDGCERTNGHHDRQAFRSPPTPGLPEDEDSSSSAHPFAGLNPERLRQLGIPSGA
ncbi:MAG: histone methyltransferase set2 [Candelina submexicana]|nr:MAG: histone methyltransferase set2 [Candelina submexicana]